MSEFNWNKFEWHGRKPDFVEGQKVFVIRAHKGFSRVLDTRVRCIPVNLIKKNDLLVRADVATEEELNGFFVIWSGYYDMDTLNLSDKYTPIGWWESEFVFSTEAEATNFAKWHSAEFTDEEWKLALGEREVGNWLENCELKMGDINDGTSELRDLLYQVQERKGCMEIHRQEMQGILDGGRNRPSALDNPESVLSRVFAALNLVRLPREDDYDGDE